MLIPLTCNAQAYELDSKIQEVYKRIQTERKILEASELLRQATPNPEVLRRNELKIKETETRIESEVAGLRERVEGVKFSTLQWLMGVCTGTAALLLGAWRLLM